MRALKWPSVVRALVCFGVSAGVCSAGCGDSTAMPDGPTAGEGGVRSDMAAPAAPVFAIESVAGCGSAGYQTAIAVGGGTIGIATLADTVATGMCKTMNGMAEVRKYDICYAESKSGAAFTTKTVASEQYLALTGISVALDGGGDPTIAYTGGGMSLLRCGAVNLRLLTAKGGTFAAPRTIATTSASAGVVPDQMSQCIQNVCNSGDATGNWPAIAFAPDGTPSVGWRDIHYGFATTDFAFSDVEYGRGPAYSDLTVDVSRGGGAYLRIAFTPTGRAALVHYNEEGKNAIGVWINHEIASGWEAVQINTTHVGEQLGFGINARGLHALAYYDSDNPRLVYQESMDGTKWTDAAAVDTDGITGLYPSLAFDAAGEPAIAYYRCNDYSPNNRNCDPAHDGLMIARRANGRWHTYSVVADSSLSDGFYPALAFVAGKAVIAFQDRSFDPGSGKNQISLHVAREQ